MSAAARIEDQAAHWLLRREAPGWTAEDDRALDRWLDEATAHRVAYLRLSAGWARVDRLAALRGPDVVVATLPPARPRSIWRPGAIAAALVLTLLAGGAVGGGWLIQGRNVHATEVGGHTIVPLADGSRIELNTDSRVRAVIDEEKRLVWLEKGEAFFDVAHDGRPFVVRAGDRRIVVLGTKFSVRRDGRKVLVSVLEGRVRVEPLGQAPGAPPVLVTGGDRVIAEARSTLVATRSADRVAADLAWRRGLLIFDQTSLRDAAVEFNRYNRRKIVITDPKVAEIRIGGSFDAENLDAFARLLNDGFDLTVEAEGDVFRISE